MPQASYGLFWDSYPNLGYQSLTSERMAEDNVSNSQDSVSDAEDIVSEDAGSTW